MKPFLSAALAAAFIAAVDGLKLTGVLYQRYENDELPLVFSSSTNNNLPISYAPDQNANTGTDNSLRNLDAFDTIVVIDDDARPSTGGGRRLAESDAAAVSLLMCNAKANSIVSYKSAKSQTTTTTTTESGSKIPDAEGKCYDYTVKVETVSVTAGCNEQNAGPNGCDNIYYPGCGGLSVDPKTKQVFVARTGGRTIGQINYVGQEGGECNGRVLDWLIRYRGRKFNGPTDITFTQNGNLYFTDSPFALASSAEELLSTNLTVLDSKRELPFNGIYLRTSSTTEILDANLTRPRGIAFSPEEDVLYANNADALAPYVKAYKLLPNGTIECARRFFDFSNNTYNVDGTSTIANVTCLRKFPSSIKVDAEGFVYVAMCNNIYVFDAAGVLLGRLEADAEVHTLTFGKGIIYVSSQNSVFALRVDPEFDNSQATVPNTQNSCAAPATLLSSGQSKSTSSMPYVGGALAVAAVAALAIFATKKTLKDSSLHGFSTMVVTPPSSTVKSHCF
ncbi:hypothetical protein DYB32_010691 [Aphanomyces invadans]|uniref:SMP-30/Gluconolactonase/LRE-like region domain-containing protein n=1 Tax=Aphanomyces invadans TaxID=157072 RepID=A0A3R6Y2K3_9STRA|nr:hypothetical protein DYB32_010691 [Aphanomyces invadans]